MPQVILNWVSGTAASRILLGICIAIGLSALLCTNLQSTRLQSSVKFCNPAMQRLKLQHVVRVAAGGLHPIPVRATFVNSCEGGGSSVGPHPAPGNDSKESSLFNRHREKQYLQHVSRNTPTSVLLMTGPVSSGKTALLEDMVQRLGKGNVVYINGRRSGHTPADLAAALTSGLEQVLTCLPQPYLQEALQYAGQVAGSASVKLHTPMGGGITSGSGPSLLEAFLTLFQLEAVTPWAPDLQAVLQVYRKVIELRQQAGDHSGSQQPYLTIIFDEATALKSWSERYREDLTMLMRFLVVITKQQSLAHVWLATSDSSYHAWLAEELGPFWYPIVIGDLGRDEAKDFFRQKMGWPSEEAERRGSLPLGPLLASASASADDQGALASLYATVVSDQTSPALQSEIVDEVVKVVGGNPVHLKMVAWNLQLKFSLDQALSTCRDPTMKRVFDKAEGPGYTLAQFLDILTLVTDRGGACTELEVQSKLEEQMISLGSADGQPAPSRTGHDVLKAMVAANAVALRPSSHLTPSDLPPGVHRYRGMNLDVVMAPSAVAYHCWQLAQPILQDRLQRRRKKSSMSGAAAQAKQVD